MLSCHKMQPMIDMKDFRVSSNARTQRPWARECSDGGLVGALPCTNVWFIWYNDCFLVCLTIHDTWEKNKVCEKLNENHAYMWEGIYYPSVLLIARHFCYIKPCLVLFNFEIKRYWLLSASGEIWAEDLFSLASLRQDEIVAAFGEYMWKYLFHLRIGSRKIAWVAAQKKACSRVS